MSVAGAAISLGAAILSAFFTASVLRRYLDGRKSHNLMWTVGLALFTLTMVVQFVAEATAWTEGLFKAWYVFGTSLVGFLGAGSVSIANRRLGTYFAAYVWILFVAFLFMAAGTSTDPSDLARFTSGATPSGEGWIENATVRRMSPLFTIPGSVTLIGIALYGLVRFRLMYNAWIAAGATVLAVGTGLARFGIPSLIYGAEFAGIALMFVGFLKAIEWAKGKAKSAPAAPPVSPEAPPAPTVEALSK